MVPEWFACGAGRPGTGQHYRRELRRTAETKVLGERLLAVPMSLQWSR